MNVEMWQRYRVDNSLSDDVIIAVVKGNKYYFKNETSGTESKIYRIFLGKAGLSIPLYRDRQLQLYSGRKTLFIQGSAVL